MDQAIKFIGWTMAAGGRWGPFVAARNPELTLGAARAAPWLTSLAAFVVLVGFGAMTVARAKSNRLAWWIPALLIGGAVSNLIDRVMFEAVRDVLATRWIAFNPADLAVVVGLVGFARDRAHRRHECAWP
jgi:lipoprotein signal peptidase